MISSLLILVLSCPMYKPYAAQKIPTPALEVPKPQWRAHKDYLEFLRSFNSRFCTKETQSTFDRLAKRARSTSAYVPESFEGNIDVKTIQAGMAELDKKWQWLVTTRDRLKAQKSWPDRNRIFTSASSAIESLLQLKERHFLMGDTTRTVRKESEAQLKKLKDEFEKLTKKLYFLTSYDYPTDHLKQRKEFDANKVRKNKKQAETANLIMFKRKLQEDGTFDADQSNSDIYLRTTLNTLSLALQNKGPWLSEDIRHDLEWVIKEMRKQLGWGQQKQIARIQIWINRVAERQAFYRKLLNEKEGQMKRQLFVESREASKQLKKFVYEKNAEVYKALLEESELNKALYVFDQILLYEVGNATLSNFRDREDVAQVVINSRFHPDLSVLSKKEELYKQLVAIGVDKSVLKKSSWLNVMFKELRFSFTLYYIPAVRHVFCPDFFRTAEITREKNLHLITKILKKPRLDFHALRYFSRWSMIGRIDMSQVW